MKYCPQCGTSLEERKIDGARRYVCPAAECNFIDWNNPTPVVAALVLQGDQVILARNVSWPRGIFSLITGYLEQNETPEQCVIREVREELDLEVYDTHFIGHYIFREKNQLILAFAVNAGGEVRLNEELAEYRCLPQSDLEKYDFRPLYVTEAIVADWLRINNTNKDK